MPSILYDDQIFALQQYGGISRYFCELAPRVHRTEGFSARVLAPVHFNDYLRTCPSPTTGLHIPMRVPRTGRLYRGFNRLASPVAIHRLHPDLVHQTYYSAVQSGGRHATVVTVFDMIHELYANEFPAAHELTELKRKAVRRANHVVCISRCTAADLARLFDVPSERISVTYLGFSDIFATPKPPGEDPPHARPYLLYVGHRARYKNFARALEAWATSPSLRNAFDFVAFGGHAMDISELDVLDRLGVPRDRFTRLSGSDKDLARAYRHARAFVYPSMYEGFGIPPLEAMSAGCAVACSQTSSVPEVVGDAAELFDPSSHESIRLALESVCFDEARRSHLIDAGRERVTLFSWDHCTTQTLAAYRRVLEDAAAG